MSQFKFTSDQFLGLQELQQFQEFVGQDNKKHLIEQTGSFGIVKSVQDSLFNNFKVSASTNSILAISTKSYAVDKDGMIITQRPTTFTLPASNIWYWLIISHKYDATEKGTVSIDGQGSVTGVGTEFLKVLRGQPNFPTTITFNSQNNQSIYQVVEVIDDENMIISGQLISESDITYSVVGTFTPGTIQNNDQKYPYQYDSCQLNIVQEATLNTNPVVNDGLNFAIARVRYNGQNLIIEDKRNQNIWKSAAFWQLTSVPNIQNPAVGVESVCWDIPTSVRDSNIVTVGWGLRSVAFQIETQLHRIIVMTGEGGLYKQISDIQSGDFDGWRVYNANGTYCRVIQSTNVNNQIHLYVDTLNPSDFQNTTYITIVPNSEQIEFLVQDDNDGSGYNNDNPNLIRADDQLVSFDIAAAVGNFRVNNHGSSFTYNCKYRYKSNDTYSKWFLFKNDVNGYITEQSFDNNGRLLQSSLIVRRPYIVNTNGRIGFLVISAPKKSYAVSFDLGAIPGVEVIQIPTQGVIDLKVGTNKAIQRISGSTSLSGSVVFNLNHYFNDLVKNGAMFTLVFDASIDLGAHSITINTQIDANSPTTILYQLTPTDVNYMALVNKKVVLNCVYAGDDSWLVYRVEGDVHTLGQIVMKSNIPINQFDLSGKGVGIETQGWAVCNGANGTVDLRGRFVVGYDSRTTQPANTPEWDQLYNTIGGLGGEKRVTLSTDQMPTHNHTGLTIAPGEFGLIRKSIVGEGGTLSSQDSDNSGVEPSLNTAPGPIPNQGGNQSHENRPPLYVMVFIQRV
jgi:microcystin-dependent protein